MTETLKAGRELDAMIAEKVFGWRKVANAAVWAMQHPDYATTFITPVPAYSTSMDDAWMLLEALAAGTPMCLSCITSKHNDEVGLYYDVELRDCSGPSNGWWPTATIEGPSVPEAVCLATLDILAGRIQSAENNSRTTSAGLPNAATKPAQENG